MHIEQLISTIFSVLSFLFRSGCYILPALENFKRKACSLGNHLHSLITHGSLFFYPSPPPSLPYITRRFLLMNGEQ